MVGLPRVGMLAAVVVLTFPLVACGPSEEGTATAAPPPRLTFHPCDGFGPDVRVAAGINGTEPERYEDREEPYQSWACSFQFDTRAASLMVSSNGILLSRTENDSRLTRLADTEIAGHRTLLNDFPGGLQCVASVQFDTGVLEVMVGYKQIELETAEEACPLALKVAQDLAPYFPAHL